MASAPAKQVDRDNEKPDYKRSDCDAMRCNEVLCIGGVVRLVGFLK